MFGYVTIYKPELKVKDYYRYKGYYCGLCNTLREKYGIIGQMTLSYDMTFLIILLNSLYEPKINMNTKRCMVHPVKKQTILYNNITEYVADMNIALTYHHFRDDWNDEKSVVGLSGMTVLKRAYGKVVKKYEVQCEHITNSLKALLEYEKKKETSLDAVAGCFGELMSDLFEYKEDCFKESLKKIGFFLGKYIYILDAYEDLEKDISNGSYNPLVSYKDYEDYEERCKDMLTMMMAECASEFEKLPCILDEDILRNILYVGVWTKFDKIQRERAERKEQQHEQ